jgi:hypothetical protein
MREITLMPFFQRPSPVDFMRNLFKSDVTFIMNVHLLASNTLGYAASKNGIAKVQALSNANAVLPHLGLRVTLLEGQVPSAIMGQPAKSCNTLTVYTDGVSVAEM